MRVKVRYMLDLFEISLIFERFFEFEFSIKNKKSLLMHTKTLSQVYA